MTDVAATPPGAPARPAWDTPRARRRRLRRRVLSGAASAASAVGLLAAAGAVVWIVWRVIGDAVGHWSWDVLNHTTASVAVTGANAAPAGLLNAILGTGLILLGVLVIAGLLGVASGVYFAEYSPKRQGGLARSATEILSGVPSITLGYIGYVVLVDHAHWGYSLLAAWIVLAIMVIPYIARTTETAMRNVPLAHREGAVALGMSPLRVLLRIVIPAALPGIITGLLLAAAIAVGETAPLLYTANWSDHLPTLQLTHAGVPYLTYPIWTYYNYPSERAIHLANDAAMLLVVIVLLLVVASRVVAGWSQRHSERAASR